MANNFNQGGKPSGGFSRNSGSQRPQGRMDQGCETPKDFMDKHAFISEWISVGADERLVSFSEEAGKYMANGKLSKSQIRNVFGEIKRIQLKGIDTPEGNMAFMLLKPKVAYAEGRNRTKGLTLFKLIFDAAWACVQGNKKRYENFCALVEAVLAYHKAFGGKD